MLPAVQYKILETVSKKIVLPLFLNNITIIASKLGSIKTKSEVQCKTLKQELEETDLEFKILTIGAYLKEISEDNYELPSVHMHLCGIYEVLDNIKDELTILNNEYEYMQTSWFYYVIGWTFYKSQVNLLNIKKYVKLLIERYDSLLKILSTNK